MPQFIVIFELPQVFHFNHYGCLDEVLYGDAQQVAHVTDLLMQPLGYTDNELLKVLSRLVVFALYEAIIFRISDTAS